MSPPREDVEVIGRALDPDHHRIRDFMTRAAQPFDFHEVGTPDADRVLVERGLTDPTLPVVVDDIGVVEGATVPGLAARWNLSGPP